MQSAESRVDEYLTDQQFCTMMNVSPRTTNQWRRDNLGPPYIRAGLRRILYRRRDVETWLSNRTFRHRAGEVTNQVAA